jgi:hypothetical protein
MPEPTEVLCPAQRILRMGMRPHRESAGGVDLTNRFRQRDAERSESERTRERRAHVRHEPRVDEILCEMESGPRDASRILRGLETERGARGDVAFAALGDSAREEGANASGTSPGKNASTWISRPSWIGGDLGTVDQPHGVARDVVLSGRERGRLVVIRDRDRVEPSLPRRAATGPPRSHRRRSASCGRWRSKRSASASITNLRGRRPRSRSCRPPRGASRACRAPREGRR